MKIMATPDFDAENFGKSKSFSGILANQALFNTYSQEDAPEVIAYWHEKGLIKELHDSAPPLSGHPICRSAISKTQIDATLCCSLCMVPEIPST